MKHVAPIMLSCLILAATVAIGQVKDAPRKQKPGVNPSQTQTASPDRGQRVFNQNCSRCHNQPEGFPPSVSGTIARHMRVRAGLSEADYKALLHFLNP